MYALITDLPTLASLAEEAEAMEWHKGDAAAPGAVFKGHNRQRHARRGRTKCTVTDAEPGRVFAFDVKSARHPGGALALRHRSRPTAAAGSPSSTWDRRPGWFRKPGGHGHRRKGPQRRQRRAHRAHAAAAQGEGRSYASD